MADKVINIGNSDNKVTVNVTDKIVCPTFDGTATKVGHKLSFGNKTFDGSSTVILSGSDLGSVDLTSELTITGLKTFSGETYLDSLNANTGLISGNLRVVNGIIGNLTGNVTGNLSGNANTATKLQTARTLTIGNTGKSFDGSSNVSWTLSEIGAASSSHTHSYLPLSGGTVTGLLYLTGLEEGTADLTDNTELLTSIVSNNGFGDTNATGKVYKRDAIHVYNYIKNKLDSVYSAINHTHSYLPYQDTRNVDYAPYSTSFTDRGLSASHLKYNSVDGLNDGGSYHSALYIYPWKDSSGGYAHNIAFTDNGNIWLRSGTSSWGEWKKVAWTSDIPTSLPANGGDADTVDGKHASNFAKFYLSPMDSGATAASAKTWFTDTMPSALGAIVYNVPGSEKTIIAGKSSGNHGHMLQLNYDDNYLRTLRYYGGSWKSTDWEKISAGYADNAGIANNVDWSGVTNKPNFVNSFGTKTGNITIRGGQTGNGSVNLVMSNNELQASIVGLGSNAYSSTAYLPLAGGTMNLGEGLKFHADDNYFGTNLDARIISLLDGNGITCDGGLIIDERATYNGVEYVTELLRIRDSEFKWKGNDIYHKGNLSPMTTSHPANSITKTNIDNWNAVHTWYTIATANDTTNTIDTWKEIEAFVSSFKKGDNLATYLANNYLAKSGGTMSGQLSIQTQISEKSSPLSQQLVINGPNYDANATLTLQAWPGIGFHMPGRTWASLIWNGNFTGVNSSFDGYVSFYGSGFKKDNSSDNYVLLGGGGHKVISDFSMAHSHPYLPTAGGTMTGAINLSSANAKLAFGSLATSPITGYKAPSLLSNGVGIYSRYGGSSDEGAIIITEDTCVIYNSSDTGWNFQVMDKDIGTDMTNDATRSFGVNQNHQAWSLAGFVKSGSSDSYVLLGGGGHKALSDFSMIHSHPYLPLAGGTMTGTLIISGVSTGNWSEGIRINNATNGWSTLTLGGTANSGTGSDIWSLHTFNSNFYINNNGSNNLKATRLWGHSNGYTIGNTNISSNTLTVGGTFRATSSITGDTSISAGTTVTAATSVTSTAGDFYVGGTSGSRCHIKMDTTNKCIKFIFD